MLVNGNFNASEMSSFDVQKFVNKWAILRKCACTFVPRIESHVNKIENILIEFVKQLNDWFKPNTEMYINTYTALYAGRTTPNAHITV